jgi:hypothetical protein
LTGSRWLLAIDTATSAVVVAAGDPEGRLIEARSFPAEQRHSERLLAAIESLAGEAGLAIEDLAGVVVGTGPGAFTGLRVGLATAKTLAHELRIPIAGISTGEALLASAGDTGTDGNVLLLPAGPHDRVEVRDGTPPRLLPGRIDPETDVATTLIAVDLPGRAPEAALARGKHAVDGLAVALLGLGAARFDGAGAGGVADDPERLVPEYVSLPRGVRDSLDLEGGVAWSHDRR